MGDYILGKREEQFVRFGDCRFAIVRGLAIVVTIEKWLNIKRGSRRKGCLTGLAS